jgi:hypothetical protein
MRFGDEVMPGMTAQDHYVGSRSPRLLGKTARMMIVDGDGMKDRVKLVHEPIRRNGCLQRRESGLKEAVQELGMAENYAGIRFR